MFQLLMNKSTMKEILGFDFNHIVENDAVISYSNLRVGGDKIPENYLNRIGEPLVDGYISLQSEGHPVEFRNIRIKKLNIY